MSDVDLLKGSSWIPTWGVWKRVEQVLQANTNYLMNKLYSFSIPSSINQNTFIRVLRIKVCFRGLNQMMQNVLI